jgi:GTP-binding protein HflX
MVERALLVGAYHNPVNRAEAVSLLAELEELVGTLGVPVMDRMLVHSREMHAQYLIGTGKAAEISERLKAEGLDALIIDNELSPSQQRNWEKLTGVAVLDRQEVILDIFAQRARTHEARLQIDLARLEYALPRLTRAWGHLVRQGGGIGNKGEGESQLEQDKRQVRTKIQRLKAQLAEVRSVRGTQRKDRKRTPVPNAAIVGYTNSGKSSLMRRLTGAQVLVEDKLFATLDTTTRKVELPNHQPLLLTDTVGFVRRLPHRLVEAFRATLEESVLAEFLIHVMDVAQDEVLEFHDTTMKVLSELGAETKRMILAFNKVDLLEDRSVLEPLRRQFPDAHFISVHTGEGMDALLEHMAELASSGSKVCTVRLNAADGDRLARLHRSAQVLQTNYDGDVVEILAVLSPILQRDYQDCLSLPAAAPGQRVHAHDSDLSDAIRAG